MAEEQKEDNIRKDENIEDPHYWIKQLINEIDNLRNAISASTKEMQRQNGPYGATKGSVPENQRNDFQWTGSGTAQADSVSWGEVFQKMGSGVIDTIKNSFDIVGEINQMWADLSNGNIKGFLGERKKELQNLVQAMKLPDAIDEWFKLNNQIFDTGRNIGMVEDQMEGFTTIVAQNSEAISRYFNVSSDKYIKSVNDIFNGTGRVHLQTIDQMFSTAFLTEFNAVDLVGKFSNIAGSTTVAAANFMKLQQNAGALGLNLQNAKNTLKDHLDIIQRVTFKEGVNGLEKMVLLTQQMKLDFAQVTNMASKFLDAEDAIKTSARLNALGGNVAMQFSNPLEMMYYANYDSEGLTEKLINSLQGMAKFNWKTGVADISALDKRRLTEMEKATGINDLRKLVSREAEVNAMKSTMAHYNEFNQTQIDMITNRAEYNAELGQFEVEMKNGDRKNISDVTVADLPDIVSNDAEDAQIDIRDNVRDIAHMMKQRMATKGTNNLSVKETFDAARASLTKTWLNRIDSLMESTNDQKGLQRQLKYDERYGENDYIAYARDIMKILGFSNGVSSMGEELANTMTETLKKAAPLAFAGLDIVTFGRGEIAVKSSILKTFYEDLEAKALSYINAQQLQDRPSLDVNEILKSNKGGSEWHANEIHYRGQVANPRQYHYGSAGYNPAESTGYGNGSPYSVRTFTFDRNMFNGLNGIFNSSRNSGTQNPKETITVRPRNDRHVPKQDDDEKVESKDGMTHKSVHSKKNKEDISSSNSSTDTTTQFWATQPSSQSPKIDTYSEIKDFATTIEGVVNIDDPQLLQKALLAVIKIQDIMVLRSGSAKLNSNVSGSVPKPIPVPSPVEKGGHYVSGGADARVVNGRGQRDKKTSGQYEKSSVDVNLHVDVTGVGVDQMTLDQLEEMFTRLLDHKGFASKIADQIKKDQGKP